MKCNNTLCRHNGVTEKICCCKNPETFCKYLEAKEILQMFLNANDNLDMINAQRKAEIFLNSSEKPNNSDKE